MRRLECNDHSSLQKLVIFVLVLVFASSFSTFQETNGLSSISFLSSDDRQYLCELFGLNGCRGMLTVGHFFPILLIRRSNHSALIVLVIVCDQLGCRLIRILFMMVGNCPNWSQAQVCEVEKSRRGRKGLKIFPSRRGGASIALHLEFFSSLYKGVSKCWKQEAIYFLLDLDTISVNPTLKQVFFWGSTRIKTRLNARIG